MIEDVYEPLARYRDEFHGTFSRLVREKFKDLLARSGVDVKANRKQATLVRKLQGEVDSTSSKKSGVGCVMGLCFLVAAAGLFVVLSQDVPQLQTGGIFACVIGLILGFVLMMMRSSLSDRLRQLRARLETEKAKAWELMEPLNRLYTWDLTTKLIEATVPRLQFDPYFTAQRLADLERIYGWDEVNTADKSILFSQSGVINGNPFVFGDYLYMRWEEETYQGSKTIHWTEWETDSEGRRHPVTRSETLTATVTAPKPAYKTQKFLLYGNDAAPDLMFTRKPSSLSDSSGWFHSWRMKRQVAQLQEFSRNLTDNHPYTMMANHEFEALFETKDRTDEVQYRLLFTPVAQQQMLLLLKDRKIGFGDDFVFQKDHKINLIFADHLTAMTLDTNPAQFQDWDIDRARSHFISFNEQYFKNVYFALAPLLAIPLYQQTRNHEEIWKGVIEPGSRASSWECEALANFHGEKEFAHPECITRSLLKAKMVAHEDGVGEVNVTAYGYRGIQRVTEKIVFGGDGNFHSVPVEWIEYEPVSRTRVLSVAEGNEQMASRATAYRRSIYSWFDR